MPTTPTHALPYPAPGEVPDVPTDLRELAEAVETALGADTGWLDLQIVGAGFAAAGGQKPQARQIGRRVFFRGMLSNNAAVTAVAHVMTLPFEVAVPGGNYTHHVACNANTSTVLNRYFEVRADGKVWGYAAAASAAWWSFNGSYLAD